MENKEKSIRLIEELLKAEKFEEAWKEAEKTGCDVCWEELGYLFKKYARWGNAINCFRKVLDVDESNQKIKAELEFLQKILELEQLDIYASTNLNKDPWLE